MALGRLIRVQKFRSDPLATIYIVAEPQGRKASKTLGLTAPAKLLVAADEVIE
jgi:hypothetical protein